jgi:hypothetical protein
MAQDDPVHRLEILAASVGKPDRSLLDALLEGTSDAELVKIGRTIRTERILVDTARIYASAWSWWKEASKEERAMLRGASEELLVLAIHQALELERLRALREGAVAAEETSRAVLEREAELAVATGLALRDQAYDAMRDAAGQDVKHRTEVAMAVGTAENEEALALGLEALARVLNDWLQPKKGDSALGVRLSLANLDKDYATALHAAALRVRTTAAKVGSIAPNSKVTQGDLDRADGINVLLLGQLIRAFDGAHNINPTVPRLVPISTRRLFSRRKKVEGEPESEISPTPMHDDDVS